MENFSSVEKEIDFLRFILSGNQSQSTLLLRHITRSQTDAVSEVFLNLLHSEVLPQEVVEALKPYKTTIRKVGDSTSSYLIRRLAITKHTPSVYKVLLQVENILPFTGRDE